MPQRLQVSILKLRYNYKRRLFLPGFLFTNRGAIIAEQTTLPLKRGFNCCSSCSTITKSGNWKAGVSTQRFRGGIFRFHTWWFALHWKAGRVMDALSNVCLQQMRRTGNKDENKRILMDLDVVLKSHDCPYIIQCYGAIVTNVSQKLCSLVCKEKHWTVFFFPSVFPAFPY